MPENETPTAPNAAGDERPERRGREQVVERLDALGTKLVAAQNLQGTKAVLAELLDLFKQMVTE